MKKLAITTTILGLLIASPTFAADPSCEKFATNMTKHAVDILHDAKQNEAQKRQSLSSLFKEAVDTDWIGKFVLGRFWKNAGADEQAQYLKIYRDYITNNYISKFNDEDGVSVDDIKVSSITPKQDGQFEAKTLILRKSEEDVSVDYLLEKTANKCQVHDIKLEGVSLLASQRSEFGALASKAGVKGVIEAMQKKLSN